MYRKEKKNHQTINEREFFFTLDFKIVLNQIY